MSTYALTIYLEEPIKDAYAAELIAAIRLLRGVREVQSHDAGAAELAFAQMRVRNELIQKLFEVLTDE